MHASLHHSHWHTARFADDELSGMSDGRGTRERRDLRVGDADSVSEIVGERAETGAEHEADFWAQLGLREDEGCGGFSAGEEVCGHS